MKKIILISLIVISLFLLWCSIPKSLFNWEKQILNSWEVLDENFDIVSLSKEILSLMQDDARSDLSQFVHPVKWVRFSPYTYIDLDHSAVLLKKDFESDLNSGVLLWWYSDGAGFEIKETKYDYFKQWVYSTGFLFADHILINQKVSRWNNLNNIDDVFPDSQSVEYYFDWFDPQYEWIDRLSLTLVFEEYGWHYYLVWLIRGSWTI